VRLNFIKTDRRYLRGTHSGDGKGQLFLSVQRDSSIEIFQEIREYLASDGVGIGKGWGSSSGAYIFRTIVPALFGVFVAIAEGYVFGGLIGLILLSLLSRLIQRRKRFEKKTKISKKNSLSFKSPLRFFPELLVSRLFAFKSSEWIKCIVFGIFSICIGFFCAKEMIIGGLDWLLYPSYGSSGGGGSSVYFNKQSNHYDSKNMKSATGAGAAKHFNREDTRGDIVDVGSMYVAMHSAVATSAVTLFCGWRTGATAVPFATLAFLVTTLQNPDSQSRPLPVFPIHASNSDKEATTPGDEPTLSVTLSEGPVVSTLMFSVGGGVGNGVGIEADNYGGGRTTVVQSLVVEKHRWRKRTTKTNKQHVQHTRTRSWDFQSVSLRDNNSSRLEMEFMDKMTNDENDLPAVEFVTLLAVSPRHEVVARFGVARTVHDTQQHRHGGQTCEMSTDDGLHRERIFHTNAWDSVSASFVPLRSAVSVSCHGRSRVSPSSLHPSTKQKTNHGDSSKKNGDLSFMTLVSFSPTGVRPIVATIPSLASAKIELLSLTKDQQSTFGRRRRRSSSGSGSRGLEVMLHRSLPLDDEKGLQEPLLDDSRAELRHLVAFGGSCSSSSSSSSDSQIGEGRGGAEKKSEDPHRHRYRKREQEHVHIVASRRTALAYANPVVVAIKRADHLARSARKHKVSFHRLFLQEHLPPEVHLLTLQWWPTRHLTSLSSARAHPSVTTASGTHFKNVAAALASVHHASATRLLFVRLQHLGSVEGTSESSCNFARSKSRQLRISNLFLVPSGHILCGAVRTSLDFISVKEKGDGSEVIEIEPGSITAFVVSFAPKKGNMVTC